MTKDLLLACLDRDVLSRCKALSSQNLVAPRVRQLFHSSTYYNANVGCLLEQAARYSMPSSDSWSVYLIRHIMGGLRKSVEQCEAGSTKLLASVSLSDTSTKSIASAAADLVSCGVRQQ